MARRLLTASAMHKRTLIYCLLLAMTACVESASDDASPATDASPGQPPLDQADAAPCRPQPSPSGAANAVPFMDMMPSCSEVDDCPAGTVELSACPAGADCDAVDACGGGTVYCMAEALCATFGETCPEGSVEVNGCLQNAGCFDYAICGETIDCLEHLECNDEPVCPYDYVETDECEAGDQFCFEVSRCGQTIACKQTEYPCEQQAIYCPSEYYYDERPCEADEGDDCQEIEACERTWLCRRYCYDIVCPPTTVRVETCPQDGVCTTHEGCQDSVTCLESLSCEESPVCPQGYQQRDTCPASPDPACVPVERCGQTILCQGPFLPEPCQP